MICLQPWSKWLQQVALAFWHLGELQQQKEEPMWSETWIEGPWEECKSWQVKDVVSLLFHLNGKIFFVQGSGINVSNVELVVSMSECEEIHGSFSHGTDPVLSEKKIVCGVDDRSPPKTSASQVASVLKKISWTIRIQFNDCRPFQLLQLRHHEQSDSIERLQSFRNIQ